MELRYDALRDVDRNSECDSSLSFHVIDRASPQTPFWANNHSDMYVRVLQDELQFPDDRTMDQDTKSLIRGVCCVTIEDGSDI